MRWVWLAVLLSGCAGTETVIETVRVEVPVYEPCPIVIPEPAAYATEALTLASTDFEKIKALLVERQQRALTEKELRTLLASCVD